VPDTVWSVYLVRTRHGHLYTGIATDVTRRFAEHQQGGSRGSKYLRAKGPLELVFQARIGSRSLASKAEARIRKLSKQHKEELVSGALTAADLLGELAK
jgi:putative endonuclease